MTAFMPPERESGPLLEVWLSGEASAVPQARHRAWETCVRMGISEDDCAALDLALGEALANAVVHGRPQSDPLSAPVRVSLWDYQGSLVVEIKDSGPGFDPPAPPYEMPAAHEETTHGRGLPLMQMLTDAFLVCRGDPSVGGAAIYLIKTLPSPSC